MVVRVSMQGRVRARTWSRVMVRDVCKHLMVRDVFKPVCVCE